MLNLHKQVTLPIVLSAVLTLLISLMYLSKNDTVNDLLERVEAISYDFRLKLSIPIPLNATPPIAIIDIDESSLKNEGRWPWSRAKLAKLIAKLSDNSVAVIAIDIVQSEKERNPANILKQEFNSLNKELPSWFSSLSKNLDADAIFSKTIRDKEVVLGYAFHKSLFSQTGLLPNTSFEAVESPESLTTIDMLGYTANIKSFTENAASSGFFSITPDSDGAVRRAPIVVSHNGEIYPSLALEAARLYLLEDSITLRTANTGSVNTVTGVALGNTIIPTDEYGRILIPYLAKQRHFTYYSATDILHADTSFPGLENAVVFIGTSAVGLLDLRPTPVQSGFPGVEIQATILHGLLHPEIMAYAPDWTDGATIFLLALLGVIMVILYPQLQPKLLILSALFLLLTVIGVNFWLWKYQHINLPLVMPLFLIMVISSLFVIHNLLDENKQRKRIHDMFGRYVPLKHIDQLIGSRANISMDGEKREMTVLFSDIRNFTALSEPLSTHELKTFLNQYLTPITEIIFKHQGTIDKYVGDLVMAFWGAPIENKNHASLSIKAALTMQNKITEMQGEFKQLGMIKLEAGIGVHTGEMNVGDMGSDYRRAYTVLGDAVNLGSRLESLTKFYGVKILTSEATKEQCPDIAFRYVDQVRVKGKQDALKIYEPVTIESSLNQDKIKFLEQHEQAFKKYLEGEWKDAEKMLTDLLELTSEPLYQLYLDRIKDNDHVCPSNWDGIYTHSTK